MNDYNSLEMNSYCELPTMRIHQAITAPHQSWWQSLVNKKTSLSKENLINIFTDKNATTHYRFSNRDDSSIAYLALRNSQLVELHVYPSRLAAGKKEAKLLGNKALELRFCNWSSNDNIVLGAIAETMETLMAASIMPRVIDLDHANSETTEYIWSEAVLLGRHPNNVQPQSLVRGNIERLQKQLMRANWLMSFWVNRVHNHSSKYSHSERLALLL